MLEDDAYLLEGGYSQMGWRGRLRLDDGGRFSFTLAGGDERHGAPKWLKKRLGEEVDGRIRAGEEVTIFDVAVAEHKIKWLWNMPFACRVEDGRHKWLITLRNPMTLTSIGQVVNLFQGSKEARPWKEALAQADAK